MESLQNKNPKNYNRLCFEPMPNSPTKLRIIEIDLIDACNLKCPMCLRQEFKDRPKLLDKDYETHYENLLDFFRNIKIGIGLVKLVGSLSEPTLYPKLLKLITFLNNIGTPVQISTNGNKRDDDFWINLSRIMSYNEHNELIFAIEGYKENYKTYRIGGNFDIVDYNIRLMKDIKCKIGWQYIKFQHNKDDFQQIEEHFKGTFDFVDIYHCNEPISFDQSILPTQDIIKKFYEKRVNLNKALQYVKQFNMASIKCKSEYNGELFIDVNGYLWPCTNLFEYNYQMGLIPNEILSINDIDNPESPLGQIKLNDYIKRIYSMRSRTFECFKSCSNYGHKLEQPFLKQRLFHK